MVIGAVTWFILDKESVHLDTIDLRGNSRVLIVSSGSTHVSVNTISSDSSGQVFIAQSQSISIFTQLSPCLVAFNSSVLRFGNKMGSSVTVQRTLSVYGKLDLSYSPSVEIGRYGGTFIMHPGSSPNQLDFKNFVIHDSQGYQVSLLQNDGIKVMNISGGKFAMGVGSSFNSGGQLTLLADEVIINGAMTAPTMTNAIWNSLSVRSQGSLGTKILSNAFKVNDVIVHGSLRIRNNFTTMNVNNLTVSGTFTLAGFVNLFDQTGASNVNITVIQSGMLQIIGTSNNSALNFSQIGAKNIDVFGQFLPGLVMPTGGWSRLRVLKPGSMVVEFINHLRIDRIDVSGKLQVLSIANISGLTKERTDTISLESGGTFTLNSQKDTGVSIIRVSKLEVNGTFIGGRVTPVEGWDQVRVGPHGNLNLELTEELRIDEITVSGNLEIAKNVTIRGLTNERTSKVLVNTGGSFNLNSQRVGTSYLRISDVEINGRFLAGNASTVEGWNRFVVRGSMIITLFGDFLVDDVEITGNLEVTNGVTIRGYTKPRASKLLVNTGGSFILNSQKVGTSFLRISYVEINGRFLAGKASTVEGWDRLVVHGNMNIYFIGDFLVDDVVVSGSLAVTNNATIRGYTKQRTSRVVINVGGSITLNSEKNGTSYLRMSIVEVNGQFLTGDASTVEGWDSLVVKPHGMMKVSLTSDFQVDRIEVSGNLEIENSAIIRGFSENRTRDIVINNGGAITLDSQKTLGVSIIRAYNVSINGRFQAGVVSPGQGWNLFGIGSQGTMTVTFHDPLPVDTVIISGNLVVSNAVTVHGYSMIKTSEFKLETGSSVKFMAESYDVSCSKKTAYSELQTLQLSIKGLFQASPLSIHDGIDDFSMSSTGNFQFYPVGEFWFNRFNVNGKMTSYRDAIFEGRHNLPIPHALFGPSSNVLIQRCFNNSRIIATRVTIAGKVVTDLLVIGHNWQELTVTGTFVFRPADTFNITKTVINGTWRSDKQFRDGMPLLGNTMVVNVGGTISLNYQQKLEEPTNGSIPSIIRMTSSIAIHGRFEAGSVDMVTNDMTISTHGLLTVDWGGYASGQGPGAGSAATSGSSGASHGGRGGEGVGVSCHRLPYGSIYRRGTWGSGGGHAGNMGGRGGGIVFLHVHNRVQLDGRIQSLGERGKVSLFH
jgi:hypothetical protein